MLDLATIVEPVSVEQFVQTAKVVAPIMAWVAWVNHSVKQNRKDIDAMFYKLRGNQGMRCRSIKGRIQRGFFNLRKENADGEPDSKCDGEDSSRSS